MRPIFLAVALFFSLAGAAFAQAPPVRVIIEWNDAGDSSIVTVVGGTPLGTLQSSNSLVASVPAPAITILLSHASVGSVTEDAVVSAQGGGGPPPPPPPPQALPWGVNRIDAELAWFLTRGAGQGIHVVDTGIHLTHPDLIPVTAGPNYVNPTKNSNDDNGHGSHVAGIAAARDNTIGYVGVAPSAGLTAVKVLDKNGSGWISNVIKGIDWSKANGAEVINLSLGTTTDVPALHTSVDAAVAAGVIVVAAAGNNGHTSNAPNYPGAYASVICCGATDSGDLRAYFSTFGPQLDLAAPGVSIPSTWKGGGYNTISGTSMATPHVAGAAALARAAGVANVRAALEGTADDLGPLGWDPEYGHGLVDAEEAATGVQTNP